MTQFFKLFWQALREIFDEAAYERYLTEHHEQPSAHSYAEFLNHTRTQRERRPRCC